MTKEERDRVLIQNDSTQSASEHISKRYSSKVCIVGGGPGGVMLAYMLVRNGISVTLLEAQKDFDRQFRGDTIHAGVMENLEQLGLMDELLKEYHFKIDKLMLRRGDKPASQDAKRAATVKEDIQFATFERLKTRFPYILMMAQPKFLNFMIRKAKQFPEFTLLMGASAQKLIQDGHDVVQGVRFRQGREWGEVRASLTVAADGRSSKLRAQAGLEPTPLAEPLDVLWFRLPKEDGDAPLGELVITGGGTLPLIRLEREDHWQCGVVVPNSGYQMLRKKGIEIMHNLVVESVPEYKERVESTITDWKKIAWLNVTCSRLEQWWLPGLLFIGDAAHVMSPLGGVGINYAIQDAVVAANVLVRPLQSGSVTTVHLAEVQRQREWPTKFIQRVQAIGQRRVLGPGLLLDQPFEVPRIMPLIRHVPFVRDLIPNMIGFGIRRVVVEVA